MTWLKTLKMLGAIHLISALVGGIADGITVEVATNENTNKYAIEETTEHNIGACEGYCEECAKYDADEFYESEEYIEMKKLEEELKEIEEENVKEEEYVEEEETITDEEIRNAYYNIPNFKETFRKLQDEHEGLDIIKNHTPRGNNWKHEAECKENADEWTLEDVRKIQVQGKVLETYKNAIMNDCYMGYVSSTSEATALSDKIWDVICDIELNR